MRNLVSPIFVASRGERGKPYICGSCLIRPWNFSSSSLVTGRGEQRKQQLRRDFSMSRCEIRTPEGRRPRRLPYGVKGNFAPRRKKDPADAYFCGARLWRALAVRNKRVLVLPHARGSRIRACGIMKKARRLMPTSFFGGSYRARTCDPLLVRQMLSQLS